jgi:mRNA-degrading endonuclease RelE of RelBE toxin-antitoxin system
MFKIVFHKKVEKFLEKRDNKFLKTFKKQILELSLNPYNNKLDIKHFDSNP